MAGIELSTAALIERVKAANAPNRHLDDAIARHLEDIDCFAPHYTESLSAVERFVERRLPGCYWLIGKGKTRPDESLYSAAIWLTEASYVRSFQDVEPDIKGEHNASAALAFLLAALVALQVKEKANAGNP